MKKYDYLIVGSGLYGAVFAQQAQKKGKKVLVIDKRPNIAGNVYTEDIEKIHVHKYGAHIFHTNNKKVWNYTQCWYLGRGNYTRDRNCELIKDVRYFMGVSVLSKIHRDNKMQFGLKHTFNLFLHKKANVFEKIEL